MLVGPGGYAEDFQTPNPPIAVSAPEGITPVGKWSDGWYEGASGYGQAIEEHKRTNKPMVVYMSVAWCPYCRKFENEVLSTPLVQDMLKDKIKVIINPESGSSENAIAFQYGIRGFPSFFLHPPQPARAVQLYTGVSPEQFVEFFKQVLK
jgi:thioredoxin-related protein